jgi:hypothetical protein
MAGVTRAATHLSAEEVLRRWKQDPRTHRRQRWLIIYQALVDPREAAQIAKHCGVSTATVHQLISAYNRRGVAAVETPGKGGRRHGYLSLEQEQAFLAPQFPSRPKSGPLPRQPRSSSPLKREEARRWRKRPSIVCSIGMAGVNSCRVRPTPKRTWTSKPHLKKLRRARPGSGCHPCCRGPATCLKDGGR